MISNSLLKSQGYPKETFIDWNKPGKSISSLVDEVVKRRFDFQIRSETYVVPLVGYVQVLLTMTTSKLFPFPDNVIVKIHFQELFKSGQKSGLGLFKSSTADIESKLSETFDSDVIEPLLRVNRAYDFARKKPECSKYVICVVNENDNNNNNKNGLKPGITKLVR